MSLGQAEDALFVSGVVESRPQEGGGIAKAWAVSRRCFGTKWCSDVLGAWSTRNGDTGGFFKLDTYTIFSFAMTSGLASDSDKSNFFNVFG